MEGETESERVGKREGRKTSSMDFFDMTPGVLRLNGSGTIVRACMSACRGGENKGNMTGTS